MTEEIPTPPIGNGANADSTAAADRQKSVEKATTTRRNFFTAFAGTIAKFKFASEFVAGVSGAAATATAGYLWIRPKVTPVQDDDFTLVEDKTNLTLKPNATTRKMEISISRSFGLLAEKTGYYNYARRCLGRWIDGCTMKLQTAGGHTTTEYQLVTAREDVRDKNGHVSGHVGVIKYPDPIQVRQGDRFLINLNSRESIELAKSFYLLSFSTDLDQSTFNWVIEQDASNVSNAQCLIYSDSQALRRVTPSAPAELTDYHDGYDILITWV